MFLQSIPALAGWLLIFPAAFLSGSALKRWYDADDEIVNGVLAMASGFALLSFGVVLLNFTVGLNQNFIWAMLGLFVVLRIRQLPDIRQWLRCLGRELFWPASETWRPLTVLTWISVLTLFLASLTPEIGGDSLVYHLNLPKVFLARGSLNPVPEDLNSYFPLFMNNLYLIGLATGGVLSAKIFSFAVGFLLFIAVRQIVLAETGSRDAALLVGLILLLTPVFYNLLSTTYIDPALAFYVFIALCLFMKAVQRQKSGNLFMAGLFLGCALSTKYLAAISILSFSALWIWYLLRLRNPAVWGKGLFLWSSGIFLTGGFWLIRNWILVKNPIFPYLGSVFGTAEVPGTRFEIYGMGKSLYHFLGVFWDMFRVPTEFGAFSDRIGVFYFLVFPFAVYAFFRVVKSRPYTLFWISFLALWFFVCQANRYILPLLPVLLVSGILGILHFLDQFENRDWLRTAFRFLAAIGIALYLLAGIYHYRHAALLYAGKWTPAQYLKNIERTVPAANWLNSNLPENARILLGAEPRQFYFDRPLVRDVFLQYQTGYTEKSFSLDELAAFLKTRNITHVLLSEPVNQSDTVDAERLLRELSGSPLVREVYSGKSENIRDEIYRYELYEIL